MAHLSGPARRRAPALVPLLVALLLPASGSPAARAAPAPDTAAAPAADSLLPTRAAAHAATEDREERPLITDRPDFTESAAAVARVQVEAGYTFTEDGARSEHAVGEVLVRTPLPGGNELRLGMNSYRVIRSPAGDDEGFEDATLGAKVPLRRGEAVGRTAVALLGSVSLPTGSLPGDAVEPELLAAVALPPSGRFSVGANAGAAWADEEGDRFLRGVGSVAVGVELSPRVGAFVEGFGFVQPEENGGDAAHANAGLTWLLTPGLQADARVGVGTGSGAVDHFLGVGLSRRF